MTWFWQDHYGGLLSEWEHWSQMHECFLKLLTRIASFSVGRDVGRDVGNVLYLSLSMFLEMRHAKMMETLIQMINHKCLKIKKTVWKTFTIWWNRSEVRWGEVKIERGQSLRDIAKATPVDFKSPQAQVPSNALRPKNSNVASNIHKHCAHPLSAHLRRRIHLLLSPIALR